MKFPGLLSVAALFIAASVSAMPDDPAKIDTCIKPGVVALTFDDGPGLYNTQLLALLARKNVKATFYIIGKNAAEPQFSTVLKSVVDAGHQLASHTYSHDNLDNMDAAKIREEMTSTSDLIFKQTGLRVAYMRAPEGNCLTPTCIGVMNELGLVISHWNVDTHDWKFTSLTPEAATDKSLEEINKVVIAESNPAVDSFVLLEHEIHKFSVELLAERVIDSIAAKGYKFVTMEECIGKPAYFGGNVTPPTNGTSVPAPSGGSSTAVPSSTGGVSRPAASSTSVTGPNISNPSKGANTAGSLRVGGWAFALASAVGYTLL
ncbi:peptidoglycan-N-acetylglucosamine deacetylase [Entomortierella parvispora]|uniref:Peptidoglycan-N-acetylglucosamine deacetylase n=1 Tax=Entomortierella parvispora TaxID=205924 RepID=A0A9P3LZ23_9FUNG|nr:peptidoglycan-N-acetylglucosamine deacetylase [Entomortierella parvispora]